MFLGVRRAFLPHKRLDCMFIARNCFGANGASEQHFREMYKAGRILEFITFYQNAIDLTRVHCATLYQNVLRYEQLK